jgi:hypothetical protein
VAVQRRLTKMLTALGEAGDPDASLDWLCGICAGELGLSGGAVALMLGDHDPTNGPH